VQFFFHANGTENVTTGRILCTFHWSPNCVWIKKYFARKYIDVLHNISNAFLTEQSRSLKQF
jgi:hypothetical protein